MFIAALFTAAKTWKQSKTDKRFKMKWQILKMGKSDFNIQITGVPPKRKPKQKIKQNTRPQFKETFLKQ